MAAINDAMIDRKTPDRHSTPQKTCKITKYFVREFFAIWPLLKTSKPHKLLIYI